MFYYLFFNYCKYYIYIEACMACRKLIRTKYSKNLFIYLLTENSTA